MVMRHTPEEPEDLGDLHIVNPDAELLRGEQALGPKAYEIAHLPDKKKLLATIRELSDNTITTSAGNVVTPIVAGLPDNVLAAWNRSKYTVLSHESANDTDLETVLEEEITNGTPIPAYGLSVWAGIDLLKGRPTTLSIIVEEPSSGIGIAINKHEDNAADEFDLTTQQGRYLGVLSTAAVAQLFGSFMQLESPEPAKIKQVDDDVLRGLITLFGLKHGYTTSRYRVTGEVNKEDAEGEGKASGALLLVEQQTNFSSETTFAVERIVQYAELGSKVVHHLEARFTQYDKSSLAEQANAVPSARLTVNRTVSSPAEYDPRSIKIQNLPPDPQRIEYRQLEIMDDTMRNVITSAEQKRDAGKQAPDEPYPNET